MKMVSYIFLGKGEGGDWRVHGVCFQQGVLTCSHYLAARRWPVAVMRLRSGYAPAMQLIHTPTLSLEPQIAAHAEAMFDVLSDPAIYEFENGPPVSLDWLRDRFAKLERRHSKDGSELWLNWVIRLPTNELIGYVQASVFGDGRALIAYELGSAHWRRGYGSQAVSAMLGELADRYAVTTHCAVLKQRNFRSRLFLEKLGFVISDPIAHAGYSVEGDEWFMQRAA
ncbi:MAG: N-acetyltransferase [Betaproteobacteria bacterium]|nr:MAG: N-acetyltransferase [Betaproteobacteria bacterium]